MYGLRIAALLLLVVLAQSVNLPAVQQYIVHYANASAKNDLIHHVQRHSNLSVESHLEELDLLIVRGHEKHAFSLQDHPSVKLVELDPIREYASCCAFQNLPTSPLSRELFPWGLFATQVLDPFWNTVTPRSTINSGITICLLDTGYNVNNVDLRGNRVTGCNGPQCPYIWSRDVGGHGTSVASVMASYQNGQGSFGVIPHGADIYVVRLTPDMSAAGPYASNLVRGFQQCEAYRLLRQRQTRRLQRMVMQTAIAGQVPTAAENLYLSRLFSSGNVVVVGAAGNKPKSVNYPAAYSSVISVGAVTCNLQRAAFSSINNALDLVAPGTQIFVSMAANPAITRKNYMTGRMVITGMAPARWKVKGVGGTNAGEVRARMALCNVRGAYRLNSRCGGVRGRVCVIRLQRTVCEAIRVCQLSGARAAVVIPRFTAADPNNCIAPSTKVGDDLAKQVKCFNPKGAYIPSVTTSALDGVALLRLMRRPPVVTLVVDVVRTPYTYMDGTSFSAPYVSAIAARMWAKYPRCSGQDIRFSLVASARDLGPRGYDPQYGFGLVQASRALRHLMGKPCARPIPKPAPIRAGPRAQTTVTNGK